jgi:hypothetical protein
MPILSNGDCLFEFREQIGLEIALALGTAIWIAAIARLEAAVSGRMLISDFVLRGLFV